MELGGRSTSEAPNSVDIWVKFDPAVFGEDNKNLSKSEDESKPKSPIKRRLIKTRNFLWDTFLSTIWIYGLAKLFIGDLDRVFLHKYAPKLIWIIDYRFFVLLMCLALVLLLFKLEELWAYFAYFIFFPLIIVFWKIPKLFYRRRSWTLAIGSLQLLLNAFQELRITIIVGAPWVLSFLLIFIASNNLVLNSCIVVLSLLWIIVLSRSTINAFRPSRFVRLQSNLMDKILNWKILRTTSAIDESLQDPLVTTFDNVQANKFATNALFGVIYYRASQYWASRLDKYRRSGASIFFAAISLLYLIAQGVVTFALINYSLFKVDPSRYSSISPSPRFATFIYYSFASAHGSEISSLTPKGSLSSIIQVFEGASFIFFIFVLIATIYFGFKQTKDDDVARSEIAKMRKKGDEFAQEFVAEYDTTIEELTRRLAMTGGQFIKLIDYFVKETKVLDSGSHIPSDR